MAKALTHGQAIGRDILKEVKRRWGAGWDLLSDEQRENAICARIFTSVVMGNARLDDDPVSTYFREVWAEATKEMD